MNDESEKWVPEEKRNRTREGCTFFALAVALAFIAGVASGACAVEWVMFKWRLRGAAIGQHAPRGAGLDVGQLVGAGLDVGQLVGAGERR